MTTTLCTARDLQHLHTTIACKYVCKYLACGKTPMKTPAESSIFEDVWCLHSQFREQQLQAQQVAVHCLTTDSLPGDKEHS